MEVYRLNSPTLAIQIKNGHTSPLMIPSNALITATGRLLDNARLVEYLWNGAEIQVLAVDIQERGTRVPALTLPATFACRPRRRSAARAFGDARHYRTSDLP
jgi:hypothetical protein